MSKSYVILMYVGFDELNIRRSSKGPKFIIVSSAFVTSSSSSVNIQAFHNLVKKIVWKGQHKVKGKPNSIFILTYSLYKTIIKIYKSRVVNGKVERKSVTVTIIEGKIK